MNHVGIVYPVPLEGSSMVEKLISILLSSSLVGIMALVKHTSVIIAFNSEIVALSMIFFKGRNLLGNPPTVPIYHEL